MRSSTILNSTLTLQSFSVHSHIPVGQIIDELDQTGNDRVQPVPRHLLGHEGEERLGEGDDPLVHHVVRLAEVCLNEGKLPLILLKLLNVLKQESVGIVPR